ncbi:hypothetical protein [Proteus mirabilis]|uniref:hypothetical protein n=2 Tax=Proteus TaxID=583 RepID=UPI000BA09A2A|nr:hypothetical protein [Proteus mirabilis]ELB0940776.1 hypothetical protein [Proteus mirabilis]MBG5958455.1 hypothetical protein [Proteus mirabilis]MBI6221802.1 hypothetical protein [Proteus mirabilis]MBI6225786.1 hypothetical protein [Proteus mirabilis]MDM3803375.1 hypothetical protein [Proteus mirabilis]
MYRFIDDYPIIVYIICIAIIILTVCGIKYLTLKRYSESVGKETLGLRKLLTMDAKPLTSQTLFWLSIIIPIFSFLYFGLFSWRGCIFRVDADGFKKFIEISTLPLGLLSLSIPFTSVVNNIHRTIQTNKQIESSEIKNNIDIYYSHKKNLREGIDSLLVKELMINLDFNNENERTVTIKRIIYNSTLKYFSGMPSIENKLEYESKMKVKIINYHKLYDQVFTKSSFKHLDLTASKNIYVEIEKYLTRLNEIILERITFVNNSKKEHPINILYLFSSLHEINKNVKGLLHVIQLDFETSIVSSFNKSTTGKCVMVAIHGNDNNYLITDIFTDDACRFFIKNAINVINEIFSFAKMDVINIDRYSELNKYLYNNEIKLFDFLTHKFNKKKNAIILKAITSEPITYVGTFNDHIVSR